MIRHKVLSYNENNKKADTKTLPKKNIIRQVYFTLVNLPF